MTCSTTNHLVEHVARAICQARGIDPDEVSFASDGTTGATTISERRLDRQKASANAAIRATLEYLRENVSEGMAEAFQDAAFEYREGSFITCQQGVSRVVSAALNDIEGGTDDGSP